MLEIEPPSRPGVMRAIAEERGFPRGQDAGPRRARVLFFTSELGSGGAEKHVVRIANHLDRERFEVSIAVARGGGSYEGELAGDVRLHRLDVGATRRAACALRRLVRAERPDLVCSVMDIPNCVALAATLGLAHAPPVVIGVQVPPVTFQVRRSWRTRFVRGAIRLLYPRAARLVALSDGVRRDVLRVVPALEGRASRVYNAGYDEAVLDAARESVPELAGEGGPWVAACGRLVREKGFDRLLRAFAKVREHTPARLCIVGEGPLRGELEAEAARLGIEGSVLFAGFQDNPYRFMGAARVFALTSHWEGFGNVIVEAMALGTPVVAMGCPHGPREIIRNGESGLLVPPGDEDAMADALLRVLQDPGLRGRLAAGGEARAADFTARASAEGYGRVFAEVLAAARR